MSTQATVRDEADILAENEQLTAANATLTQERDQARADLNAANELLTTAQSDLTASNEERDQLRTQVENLTAQNGQITTERNEARTKLATAEAHVVDFDKAVAAKVTSLGLSTKPAEHVSAPDSTKDLTATERVLLAKGAQINPGQKVEYTVTP